jgi:putative peptide zinc metalloprotease protein
MSGSVLSSSWYRVADLKPRLRAHARLHRHRYRGQLWYLLQDPFSGRVHRFSPAARLFISAMDGQRTAQRLWEMTNRHLGEQAPTQDEVINLLGQLHAADLLQSDVTPDATEAFDRGERQEKAQRRRTYMNPMAVRIHLWDPDAFLNRIAPLIRLLWSRWGGLLWLTAVLPALLLISPHLPELTNNFADRVLAVDNLLLLWIVFPLIKFLHEMGHAAATKRGGGEVHDMGIILLVLIPVPYVEASAASVFQSKYERAMVGAAGMVVELFIAAVAFYLWLLAEPGIARAVLFNVMLVAGVSTLIFNGNPLLRYDAYYMLADLLEVPNLANRSLRHWGYLVERYAFGVKEAKAPDAAIGEKTWFLFYGCASSIYRVLVTVAIALFIAGQFFIIGVVLAIWAVMVMAVVPVVKSLRHVGGSPRLHQHRRRAIGVTVGMVLVLGLLLFAVPAPHRTSAEGVIWLPEQAMVRTGREGFVDAFLVAPGATVAKGELLVRSYDLRLDAQIRQSEARVAELQATYGAQFVADKARAGIVREQLESERATLALLRTHADGLLARAESNGTFMSPKAADMPGRYYRKGELLGYVTADAPPLVRVVVPQEAVDLVRLATERVSVRFAHRPELVADGHVVRQVPAGDEYLPSRALSAEGGGQIATDPRDLKGAKTIERMFQLDIALTGEDAAAGKAFFGERVYVRFEHVAEPMGVQWYRALRLLFLSHFYV